MVLRTERTPDGQKFVELTAIPVFGTHSEMDIPGESVAMGHFEVREGIEMVPGTVHLVDSMAIWQINPRRLFTPASVAGASGVSTTDS